MFRVDSTDFKFLKTQLNVSLDNLLILTEEERDFNLILDSLSSKEITLGQLKKLTELSLYKYLIGRYSKGFEPLIEDKNYIANAIVVNLAKIKKSVNLKVFNPPTLNENDAQYGLVLAGVANSVVQDKVTSPKIIDKIEWGLRNNGQRNIGINCRKWIKVIQEISDKGWFDQRKKTSVKETDQIAADFGI